MLDYKRAVAWKQASAAVTPNNADVSELFVQYGVFVAKNKGVRYAVDARSPVDVIQEYKFVGAQSHYDEVLFVPNGSDSFASLDSNNAVALLPFLDPASAKPFQWTGGCMWDGALYCFPRASNSLLSLDLSTGEASQIDLGQGYAGEHHYGGVLVGTTVYQPPRNADHLLAIDLETASARRIPLAPQWLHMRFRYCGSVLHPNGLVYFLPERDDRVIVFDPKTECFRFIGDPVRAMVFDACVDVRGHIYGFSAYEKGVLHIDPDDELVEMVRQDYGVPGCYGTKLGINGLMYGIPGDGDSVLEFNPDSYEIRSIGRTEQLGIKAKCAGGAVRDDGSIVAVPAFGSYVYSVVPSRKGKIPAELNSLFQDCY